MAWEAVYSEEIRRWMGGLGAGDRERVGAAINALERLGPALPPQLSKRIKTSRHHNMRELRSVGGNIRVLFAFDPGRRPVLLVGGDKTNRWERWYRANVPTADRIYDLHLRGMERGGGGRWRGPSRGGPTSGR